ncbi:uncharacterized protein F4812DRAFT_431449 [Daldinia caldariorum]|uniref:uncharacterized protein n=1 Tax=Daldinia caldariorum TaxID=326644 RepID=UPI002007586A|nr:uncharacterized protein F4812DRAFT_431449 [Daldinia caldariorum]KAI1467152.1 hypothetical protein F4812DRAFT_431449 [Daldinia caldariorum]
MDDTTSLVSDLLQKLAELDNKVNEYRQDMAQEFRRYSRQRLQNVPGHVSAKVEKLVAEQFQNYPALSPALDHYVGLQSQFNTDATGFTSATSLDEKPWSARLLSPPPASPQSPGTPIEDGARSPHEREREFHGLFTPSYLPLLDAVQRHTPTPPVLRTQVPDVKEPNDNQKKLVAPISNDVSLRPDPVRRYTSDTVSSSTSDDSATRPRSALRRSSGSSTKNQSPRRVRFDVEGKEVLPTSSPPMSPRMTDLPSSSLGNPTNLPDDSYNAISINEETEMLGSSPPMPKKITSTERLKALARSSTEDTSKWEVVGSLDAMDDDEENELVMAGLNGRKENGTLHSTVEHVNSVSTAHRINDARLPTQLGSPLPIVEETSEDDLGDEAEDMDDVLMMPPLSSFKNKKHFSPPLETMAEPELNVHESQRTDQKSNNKQTEPAKHIEEPVLEEEDLFEFESSREGEPVTKYIDEDEDEDEGEGEDDDAGVTPIADNPVLYSTSPAIPVTKPAASAAAPTPPSPPHLAASVGSYRGKPFSIGVVRDPELYKKAAEMGDFYTFVGSVDGRSGVDETSSYRPELTYFNGTPRSLSERLMKEDLDEERRKTNTNDTN